MIKICDVCGGIGEITSIETNFNGDHEEVSWSCYNCSDTGYVDISSTKVLVVLDEDNFVLEIHDAINRPNNPSIEEIVDAYVKYNYGNRDYQFYIVSENAVEIDENWNIENYI